MWDAKLLELGYSKEDVEENETIRGEIYMEGGYLYLDYPVLCNVDQDIKTILDGWFGSENVVSDSF